MMYLNGLMNSRNLNRAELSARSNIPESTLRDILNGKAQLDRCEAATLYNIAYALDVSVEDILEGYWDALERDAPARTSVHDENSLMNFYVLADSMLGRLRATGDLAFIDGIDQNGWIERLYQGREYRCALFLLGMMDYLCRKNGVRQVARYDEYRKARLDGPVYALRTLNVNDDDGAFQRARTEAENSAIPELGRYGIYMTEEDIRHPA
ncbi:MAG: helix-turn-helix transcriptional regulator [Christensenellales bacterium]|nr:helix-turn-helix transcriptional regulator [Christensenellales bacterium]